MRYLREEGSVLAGELAFPMLKTRFRDRHALVVARGPGFKRDLRMVRPYVRDFKPVLVAVDGGADALLEAGYRPDVIVGDMDSVSDGALRSGAELARPRLPRRRRARRGAARRAGSPVPRVSATGISEDVALQLAARQGRGADRRGRDAPEPDGVPRAKPRGMSSTFVTRLKVGEILVDAKGVSRLVSRGPGLWPLLAVVLAGLAAIFVAVIVSPALRNLVELIASRVQDTLGL